MRPVRGGTSDTHSFSLTDVTGWYRLALQIVPHAFGYLAIRGLAR